MSATRKGKRKRQNGNGDGELTQELAALIYASESEDSEKGEWGGGEEWEVEKITGEAIDMCGRREYRVEWSNWNRRSTGENFTWGTTESHLSNAGEVMAEWKDEAKAKRAAIREQHKREGVPISLFAHGCFTRFNTTLFEIGMGTESDDENYDAPANWLHAADLEASLGALRPPQIPEDHRPGQLEAGPSRRTGTSSENRRFQTYATLDQDSSMDVDLSHAQFSSENDPRNVLQDLWDTATQGCEAARVTIINDIDDERIPSSIDLNKFQYCELDYSGADSHIEALVGCDCQVICTNPLECHCQRAADTVFIEMENGAAKFAYENGLYTFKLKKPQQAVECNVWCTCNDTCENRVAQKPRRIPLEVHKTADRGWAVRATVDVQRGEVVGIFTGELFEKKGEEDHYRIDGSPRDPGYSYDLDWFQPECWAIDSQFFGNWSRFLNHSCFANLQVYSVSWDSVPDANRGRLAFAAKERIPAGTELTIDYWPSGPPTGPRTDGMKESCVCEYETCTKR